MEVVILAGGRGRRLSPYTVCFPKPLMPVGEMPILEIVLRQLRAAGCRRATLAVGHLAELIKAFFGNGERVGIDLRYSCEDEPLGTVGPLGLLDDLPEHFLVMNGDVLTTLKYDRLFSNHLENGGELTIACQRRTTQVDLGVIHFDDKLEVTGYQEKPKIPYDVSMGVYVFSRSVLDTFRPGEYLDLPDLILKLVAQGRKVKVFMSDALWLDIGRVEDYAIASGTFEENRDLFLPAEPAAVTGDAAVLVAR
ncbi:MAG: NTP transferase domain-containing protein [Pirellulales bacterium]|nr:NTP transferase domain-containing protein [Pirellulales bacterium]